MLETLDMVPWSTLEHAYGSAEDIPEKIRALVSDDAEQRDWARAMLDMGPYHQGSIYTCTPYVIRFLIELTQADGIKKVAWLYGYIARVHDRAKDILSQPETQDDDDVQDDWATKTRGEERRINRQIAQQIIDEIQPHLDIYRQALSHPDPNTRFTVVYPIAQFIAPSLAYDYLENHYESEQHLTVRIGLAFALGTLATTPERQQLIQTILANEDEPATVRLAAGFGQVTGSKDQTPDAVIGQMVILIQDDFKTLQDLEFLHQTIVQDVRLLQRLYDLSPEQKARFVPPIMDVYRNLPYAKNSTLRIGQGYYLEVMIRLSFEGVLPADATIEDLNKTQRSILEAFQQYQVPDITARDAWNIWGTGDFRQLLGIDIATEADFTAFMHGKRPAREAGSLFDQRVINHWSKFDWRSG